MLDFCGGQSLDGSTCCANGAACLTPASARNAGGYGDADIEAGGYGFYGADPETQPYSICAPEPPASGACRCLLHIAIVLMSSTARSSVTDSYTMRVR